MASAHSTTRPMSPIQTLWSKAELPVSTIQVGFVGMLDQVVTIAHTEFARFSEVVDDIDAVKPELAYNAIKNAVINKDFKIQVQDSAGQGSVSL